MSVALVIMGEGRGAMMYPKHAISVTYTIFAADRCATDVISIKDRITTNNVFSVTFHTTLVL
jgi:hypothetical protein